MPGMNEPPKRNRRWYQFSLRTLFVAVTLLALLVDHFRMVRALDAAAQHEEEMKREFATAMNELVERHQAVEKYGAELIQKERSLLDNAPEFPPPPKTASSK
jgi:hypothetical protein